MDRPNPRMAGCNLAPASNDRTRILGVVEGEMPTALSGVARFLFEALNRHLPVVNFVDYAPHGTQRAALALQTFRPDRAAWRGRFHTSRAAYRRLSKNLVTRLRDIDQEFDVVVQVHGWVGGQPRPYTLFVDQTRLMAEYGWPKWLPFSRRERSELLAREREMYEGAFHVFVMGQPARESLMSDYGLERSRITVVGGGPCFESLPVPGGPGANRTILFVGREFDRKGGDVLLAAFHKVRRQLPDAELHIVGYHQRERIPGVVMYGQLSDRERLASLYSSTRAFCLPSRYEPFGLVLLEAMAHGVPCIGTAVQSIPEILRYGEAGLLVPPENPEALATALITLLTDETLARSLGAAGRQRVEERFTWARVADRMAPILSQAPSVRTASRSAE